MTLIDKAEALAFIAREMKDARQTYSGFGHAQEALRFAEQMLVAGFAAIPARGVDVNPKAVRAAFQEGFVAGAQDGWLNNPRMDREWKASRAKKELKR